MAHATGESIPPESIPSSGELEPTGSPPRAFTVSRKIVEFFSRISTPMEISGFIRSTWTLFSPIISSIMVAVFISISLERSGKLLSERRARVRNLTGRPRVSNCCSNNGFTAFLIWSRTASMVRSPSMQNENESKPKQSFRRSFRYSCSSSVKTSNSFLWIKIRPRIFT